MLTERTAPPQSVLRCTPQLAATPLTPGSPLEGRLWLEAGQDCQLEWLDLQLSTEVRQESWSSERYLDYPLACHRLDGPWCLPAGQAQELAFSLPLPDETPLNDYPRLLYNGRRSPRLHSPVHLSVQLPGGKRLEAPLRLPLTVSPSPAEQRLIVALESLGFTLTRAEIEAGTACGAQACTTLGCYQTLGYGPRPGSGYERELTLSFIGLGQDAVVLLEVDSGFGDGAHASLLMDSSWPQQDWEARLKPLLGPHKI